MLTIYISSYIHGRADVRQLLALVGRHAAHISKHTRVMVGADVRWEEARQVSNEAGRGFSRGKWGLKGDLKIPHRRVVFGWNYSNFLL